MVAVDYLEGFGTKMGPKRLAASVSANSSTTEAARYDNNSISAHVRGWDYGVEVDAFINDDGIPCFEVWTTGGSHNTSRKKCLMMITGDKVVEE